MTYESMTNSELERRKSKIESEIQAALSDNTLTNVERNELLVDLRSILSDISEAICGYRPSDSDGVY